MEKSNLVPFVRDNLDILFIGLNPAKGSSRNRHYFSVNQSFWDQLFNAQLIIKRVNKANADQLVFGSTQVNFNNWSYGMTDLVPSIAESKSGNVKPNYQNCLDLLHLIERYTPRVAILLHGKVVAHFLPFLNHIPPQANMGIIGQLVESCPTVFAAIAFPHGNSIPASSKVEKYREVKQFLLKHRG